MASKDRSPNYPAFNLEQAAQWVTKIWDREHKNAAPALSIVKALGSESVSGPARQKIASLRQYGLLEDVGKGSYKLSPGGVTIALHKPADREYREAIQAAMATPPLFAEILPLIRSSDDTLRIHLITKRDFSEDGARRALKAFRDSASFAKLSEASYNDGETQANDQVDLADQDAGVLTNGNEAPRQPQHREASTVDYSWPLEDAEKVEVTFVGNPGKKPTRRDLEAVIEYLEIVKRRTSDALSPAPRSAAERGRIAELDGINT